VASAVQTSQPEKPHNCKNTIKKFMSTSIAKSHPSTQAENVFLRTEDEYYGILKLWHCGIVALWNCPPAIS
jgi:hypothetical protein